MMCITGKFSLALLWAVISVVSLQAQVVTEDWLKSEYTVLLAGYINWPDEGSIDTFQIILFLQKLFQTYLQYRFGHRFRYIGIGLVFECTHDHL